MGGSGSVEALVPGLDLRPALAEVLASGAGYVGAAVAPGFLARLVDEIEAGPFRSYREQFAQVRQQIEGFDLDRPFDGFPLRRGAVPLDRRDGATPGSAHAGAQDL